MRAFESEDHSIRRASHDRRAAGLKRTQRKNGSGVFPSSGAGWIVLFSVPPNTKRSIPAGIKATTTSKSSTLPVTCGPQARAEPAFAPAPCEVQRAGARPVSGRYGKRGSSEKAAAICPGRLIAPTTRREAGCNKGT